MVRLEKEPFSKAVSKEFAGEEKAKEWALQFEKETGLKATYTLAGNREAYVKVATGGIEGEDNTKAILDRFQKRPASKRRMHHTERDKRSSSFILQKSQMRAKRKACLSSLKRNGP